jgi:16S rRNA (cytosine1402-N4)-methyltransferase
MTTDPNTGAPSPAHIPVLVNEVLGLLQSQAEGASFLDCTFGGGGHTEALLAAHPQNTVIACDRDPNAAKRAAQLEHREARFRFYRARFSELTNALKDVIKTDRFDGVLADLGISTLQLWEGRGFAFRDDQALDMRMDETLPRSAADIVNTADSRELFTILKRGGVGTEAKACVDAIIAARPLMTAKDLAAAIARNVRSPKDRHPATVVFQAIRIAVNQEIEEIEALLEALPALVKPAGRAAIICFHSLEDEIVTKRLREWQSGGEGSANWPGGFSGKKRGKLLTRKAIMPTSDEIARNPASRSARLRVFEFASS